MYSHKSQNNQTADDVYYLLIKEDNRMPVTINLDLCIGCGCCIAQCPAEALELDNENRPECDKEVCIDCGTCVDSCMMQAISFE